MAHSNVILNRLCDLQGTNFEVRDVKVSGTEIVWQIEHKDQAEYQCKYCGKKHDSFHDSRWIKIKDYPFGNHKKICK